MKSPLLVLNSRETTGPYQLDSVLNQQARLKRPCACASCIPLGSLCQFKAERTKIGSSKDESGKYFYQQRASLTRLGLSDSIILMHGK